jgi:hypothetical protein
LLIGNNLDWWEAQWSNRNYLEPLLESDQPLRLNALRLLVLALAAKDPSENGLATDVLIAVITDGRLDGHKLGQAMAEFFPTGLIKAARWAKSLSATARTSILHTWVIAEAIQHALNGEPAKAPRDLHALLDLLNELCESVGTGVFVGGARRYLEQSSATGKTGKLIQSLLTRQTEPSATPAEVIQLALSARVERTRRWAIKR